MDVHIKTAAKLQQQLQPHVCDNNSQTLTHTHTHTRGLF